MFTLKIECRFDFTDTSKNDIMVQQAREKARELLTMTMLLADNTRKPTITLETGDMFETEKDMTIMDEAGGE